MRSHPAGSFERIARFQALWAAWVRYRQGKRRSPVVATFDLDADRLLIDLERQLRAGTWRPGPSRLRVVHEPKPRLIAAPTVGDRVLHEAILHELRPTWERSFVHESWACRAGRGPLRAALAALSVHRRYAWHAHLDVARFFPSVRHADLLTVLRRKLRDERTLGLVADVLRAGGEVYADPLSVALLGPVEAGRGLPLGSSMSQWLANVLLDGLDHHIKRVLKVPGYVRYMDDLLLASDDQAQLVAAREGIAAWLAERGLQLHHARQAVEPRRQALVFCGWRVQGAGLLPSARVLRRVQTRVRARLARGQEAVQRTLVAYRGHFRLVGIDIGGYDPEHGSLSDTAPS